MSTALVGSESGSRHPPIPPTVVGMDDADVGIMKSPAVAEAFETLTQQLSGSELRSFLRSVAARRAGVVEPGALLRQQQTDRFCEASDIDALALASTSVAALELAQDAMFDPAQLSPMAPLGAASMLGPVAQNNVITTMELCEIVADPTNALALVAAAQRRQVRDNSPVTRLSTVQRVARAKEFDAPGALAHFSVLGLVSVGLDRGGRRFEIEELTDQLRLLVKVIDHVQPAGQITIEVSDNSGRRDRADTLVAALADRADTVFGPPQPNDRDHYPNLFAKLSCRAQDETVQVGHCGVSAWPSDFADNRNEQCVVSGLNLDRLVELLPRPGHGRPARRS